MQSNENEYRLVSESQKEYKIKSLNEPNEELTSLIFKGMETMYDDLVEFKNMEEMADTAKFQMTKMFEKANEEFGLKSIKTRNFSITFIPATPAGETKRERVINENKVHEIMKDSGVDKDEYMDWVDKTKSARKAYIKMEVSE